MRLIQFNVREREELNRPTGRTRVTSKESGRIASRPLGTPASLTLSPTLLRYRGVVNVDAISEKSGQVRRDGAVKMPNHKRGGLNVSFPVLQRGGSPGTGDEDVPAPRAIVFMNWPCGAVKVGLIILTLYRSVS